MQDLPAVTHYSCVRYLILLVAVFLLSTTFVHAQTPQPESPIGSGQSLAPQFSAVASSLVSGVTYNVAISETPRGGANNQYQDFWVKGGLAANDLMPTNANRLTWNSGWTRNIRSGGYDGAVTSSTVGSPASLTPGKTYYWQIVGTNGTKSAQASFTVMSLPLQPTLTISNNLNRNLFEVSWNAVANVSRYELYQNNLLIYSGMGTVREVSVGSAGVNYTFMIKACNAAGCSSGSSNIGNFPVPPTTAIIQTPAIGGTATSVPAFSASMTSLVSTASYTIAISESPRAGLNGQYVDFWSINGISSSALTAGNTGQITWSTNWVKRTRYGNPDGAATIVSNTSPPALTIGKIYYWHIVASGTNGGMSKSAEGRFVVAAGSSSSSSSSATSSSVAGTVSTPVAPVMASTPSPASTIDLARALPAEFDVNNSGQATYKIPVVTAPGTAGLVPNVSLNYSSGGGNGIAGLGWSLSAYGAISRCRQTEGVDGVAKPITWSSEDRFCLNGDRLLLDSGTYGAAGSTYKTEIDSFLRVTAVGGTSGHPDYFIVEYKDGIIETYGNTTDSYNSKNQLSASNTSTVLDWSLSKRSDSAGNKIVYNYVKDADGQRIDTIDYAFGATSTRGAYLQFNYESRNDPISGYVAGHAYKTGKRVSNIKSYNGTAEIRAYMLTYNQNSAYTTNDKLSRINKVQECVGAICSPATEFEWELPDFQLAAATGSMAFFNGVSAHAMGDINGDGLQDVIWFKEAVSPSSGNDASLIAPRALFYATGYIDLDGTYKFKQAAFDDGTNVGPSLNGRAINLEDVNGDGRMDVIVSNDSYGFDSNLFKYYRDSINFVLLSKPMADGSWKLAKTPELWSNGPSTQIDANGDGLVDSLTWEMSDLPWDTELWGSLLPSDGSINFSAVNLNLKQNALVSKPLHHVLNNYTLKNTFNLNYMDFQGDADFTNDIGSAPISRLTSYRGDFNGDGRTDVIAYVHKEYGGCNLQEGEYRYCGQFSNPNIVPETIAQMFSLNQSNTGIYQLKHFPMSGANIYESSIRVIDLNNDGLSDVLAAGGGPLSWQVRINDGVKINSGTSTGVAASYFSFGYGTPSGNLTGENLSAVTDINADGYQDLIWHQSDGSSSLVGTGGLFVKYWDPATNQFETQTRSLGTLPYRFISNYFNVRDDQRYVSFKTDTFSFTDVNGDSIPDLVITPNIQSTDAVITVRFGKHTNKNANKIVAIANGLGERKNIFYERINESKHYARIEGITGSYTTEQRCESVVQNPGEEEYNETVCWDVTKGAVDATKFYQAINNPWFDLATEEQSLRPASPAMEAFGSMSVVTEVEVTTPAGSKNNPQQIDTAATAKLSYYYGHAKMQAGGRGFLGFKNFTVVNRETGIRTETEYRQDWPFIGQVRKIKTFTGKGHKLSEQVNTWGFVNCHDSLGNPNASCVTNMSTQVDASGTGALGAVKPFLRKSITETRALTENDISEGAVISTSTETNLYDTKGNVLESSSVVTSDLPVKSINKKTVNTYDYSGSTWSMQQGRLQRLAVTANDATYGAVTRTSSFTYYTSGAAIGLLQAETVEPDNSLFTVTTTHSYSLGNRTKSVTTANGHTRQSEAAYDSRGRYVDTTYGFFTNGSNPDSPIRQVVSQVISRDKYGTPTESRNYISASAYVTKKTATTAFGTPYFTADSTGAAVEIKMGTGADTNGVCPSDTKVWSTSQAAGGGTSIQCSDILGRTRRAGSIGFDGTNWSLVDTEYDKLGRTLRTSAPYWRNSSERYWTSHSYDLLGRVTATQSPYKSSYVISSTKYNNLDVEIRNPKGQIRIEKRDLAGQVIEVIDPNNGITKFAYDARGNMREMRDPALNTTVVGHDLRDRKTSMSDPDKGNWVYTYNSFGDLVCQMDGKGQTSVQRYDIAGRVFSRTDRNAGGNCDNPTGSIDKYTQWTYDTATNGLGQLASVFDSASVGGSAQYQQSFAYDGFGRVSSTTTTMPGHLGAIGSHYEKMTYDQYGRVFQSFDAARTSASFTTNGVQNIYNAQGYLSKAVDAVSYGSTQQAYYTVKTMNARGNVTSAEYGNGVTQTADYFPETGLTKKLRADRALVSLPLQDITLDWDELGNLDWREERGTAGESARRNIRETFGYDNLNRLKTWVSSGDLAANETANYNSIDNITDKTGIGNYLYGNQCGAGTNAGPHALCRAGTTNYNYDKNGNMLNDSAGRTMKYTSYDLPSEINKSSHKTEFSYGPSRARYKRVDTSSTNQVSTTLYLGSVEKVYYPDGTIQWKRNIAGVGLITQTVNSSGVKLGEAQRYLIKDHLGSLSLITDEIGAVEQSNYFDPWGRERKIITSGSIKQWLADNANFRIASKPITTRGFTGHEQLAEVGLIHMNGRIYDGALGRFVQADPIIQDPLRVQSLNRYSYVWNNPLNATDPSGFASASVCGANCVTVTADYAGESILGIAFGHGSTTLKTKEIPVILAPKNTSTAYSASANSNGDSTHQKQKSEDVSATEKAQDGNDSATAKETIGETHNENDTQGGKIVWQKQDRGTDADLEEAQHLWELAKTRRLEDGSIPESVQVLLDLENSKFNTTIKVGPSEENKADPADIIGQMVQTQGSAGTIIFNPWKRGTMERGIERIPEVSLVHEAAHVRQMNRGEVRPFEMIKHRETEATSIENWHRKAMGKEQRTLYYIWEIPTH